MAYQKKIAEGYKDDIRGKQIRSTHSK